MSTKYYLLWVERPGTDSGWESQEFPNKKALLKYLNDSLGSYPDLVFKVIKGQEVKVRAVTRVVRYE